MSGHGGPVADLSFVSVDASFREIVPTIAASAKGRIFPIMGNIDGIAQGLDHMDLVGMNKFANNLAVPILMIAHTDGADLGPVGLGQTAEGRAIALCPVPETHRPAGRRGGKEDVRTCRSRGLAYL